MPIRSASQFSVAMRCVAGTVISLTLPALSSAHPLSQGTLDLSLQPDAIAMHARVTVEEVRVTNATANPDAAPGPWATMGSAAFEQHATYLAAHLHVIADGIELKGRVSQVNPPDDPQPAATDHANYELRYGLAAGATAPHRLELWQNVMTGVQVAPGVTWDASYVVSVARGNSTPTPQLLTTKNHVSFNLQAVDHNDASAASGSISRAYFLHGVNHILTGYDHLLFISALVLGATGLWDLVKVVTAFTLAHTITLTLSTMNLVHLPEQVVEPLIAASIVFVAIENVFWPQRSRGWSRLGAAFFFGLFHGLGFAGGLLDAMHGLPVAGTLVAIAFFSLGVEAGHQLVVVPLFAALFWARRIHGEETGRRRFSLAAQRFGSAAISLAGLFYLFVALRLSVGTT